MTGSVMLALWGTLLALALVPGLSDAAVVARTVASGFHHGLLMVTGIVIANAILVLAALSSLMIFIETWEPLGDVLHTAAGIGLILFGLSTGRTRPRVTRATSASAVSRFARFLSGLFLTLGDPKALLFYLSLFPAFIDRSRLSTPEILGLLRVVTLTVGGVKTGYTGLAHQAQGEFRSARLRKTLHLVAGAILVGTGVFLLAFR
ncbi:MAG TPA: LysE family translocator [Candidatus Competibacter sp.]|nr:LysE family translocator [Candidatus Competibacteraceae bacterium]HPE72616.1 LysE family translocator [Candidatus Competibacter sp.]